MRIASARWRKLSTVTNQASTLGMARGGRRPLHPWAGTGGVRRRIAKFIVALVDRFQLVVVGDPAAEVRRVHELPRRAQLPRTGHRLERAAPPQRSSPQGAAAQAAKEACYKYTPAGSETPAENATALAKAVKFAECMRSHGEPDFPDPTSDSQFNGQFASTSPGGVSSTSFQAAQKACQILDPGLQLNVGVGSGSPGGGS
jgi:hypothetical protein